MVETLERMHHRAVAALQMRFHARIEKVTEEAQVFQNQVTYAHPWAGFQEWNPREEDAVETWVMIERSKLEKMLDNLDILLEFKKKQIRERVA